MLFRVAMLAVAAGSAPVALAAQSPGVQRQLDGYVASLEAATALRDLPAAESPEAVGPILGLREALRLIRRGELAGTRDDIDKGIRTARIVASRERDWGWPAYVTARGLAALAAGGYPPGLSEGQFDGEAYAESIWRHLRDASARVADDSPVARYIMRFLVAGGDRTLTGDQRALVARFVGGAAPGAEALLVWARHLRAEGKSDSALALFRAAEAAGEDASRLQLELARTLLARGDSAGAEAAYWRGVDRMTPVGREAYRHDLAFILTADSLKALDAVPAGELAGWLRRFWEERDAAAANRSGERLREHLRRWTVVMRDYRVPLPWRRTQFLRVELGYESLDACVKSNGAFFEVLGRMQPSLAGDLRAREPLLDHRGLIYLRHGAPVRTIYGAGSDPEGGFLPANAPIIAGSPGNNRPVKADLDDRIRESMSRNMSWLYWVDDGWRMLHFRGSDALGQFAPTTLSSYLPVGSEYINDWVLRGRVIPEYFEAAMRMRTAMGPMASAPGCLPDVRGTIARSRDDAAVGIRTDSDTPPIVRPWNAVIQSFMVGHAGDGSGRALVTFAIPELALHADSNVTDGTRVYPVHFRIVAYQPSTGRTVTIDTLRTFIRSGSRGAQDHLSGWYEIPLPAGEWQVATRIRQFEDSTGAYALRRKQRLDGGAGLALGDVVTGMEGARPLWPGDGEGFPVNVLGAWPEGGRVELFYEVRGLAAGTAYRTTLEARPDLDVPGAVPTSVRVQTSDRARGAVTPVRKTLGLATLKPGRYRLIVTVESGGVSVTRERPLLVVPK